MEIETYRQEMIESLIELIRIPSVKGEPQVDMPYGKDVFEALMRMISIAERAGLTCHNLYGHVAYIDYGEGDETLAILTHLDVVPAGEGWTVDPFGGQIIDGKIYGRGAVDDKGPAIAALYALAMLNDHNIALNKKVRLIFGCDEESGWADIDYYKAHEKDPDIAISPDGDYPIINAEKGLMHLKFQKECRPCAEGMKVLSFHAGTRVNIVPNKAVAHVAGDFEIVKQAADAYFPQHQIPYQVEQTSEGACVTTQGVSSHGSRPKDGVNAAVYLLNMLNTLPLAPGDFTDALALFVKKVGIYHDGRLMGMDIFDHISGALTFNVGVVEYDGQNFSFLVDLRYPISASAASLLSKVKYHLGRMFAISKEHELPSHFVEENSKLVRDLKEVYQEVTGEEAYCISIGGATYARAFQNAVTFGPKLPGAPSLEHGPDEYAVIDELILNAKMIAAAILKICG